MSSGTCFINFYPEFNKEHDLALAFWRVWFTVETVQIILKVATVKGDRNYRKPMYARVCFTWNVCRHIVHVFHALWTRADQWCSVCWFNYPTLTTCSVTIAQLQIPWRICTGCEEARCYIGCTHRCQICYHKSGRPVMLFDMVKLSIINMITLRQCTQLRYYNINSLFGLVQRKHCNAIEIPRGLKILSGIHFSPWYSKAEIFPAA